MLHLIRKGQRVQHAERSRARGTKRSLSCARYGTLGTLSTRFAVSARRRERAFLMVRLPFGDIELDDTELDDINLDDIDSDDIGLDNIDSDDIDLGDIELDDIGSEDINLDF